MASPLMPGPPSQPRLPNLDKRQDGAAKEQRLSEAGAAAADRLRARVPHLRIDLDEVLGTPKLVGSPDGFLSGPNGEGRGISPDKARALPAHDPHRALKAFLNEHAAMFGHGSEVLASARIKAVSAGAPIASRTDASFSRLRPANAHFVSDFPA